MNESMLFWQANANLSHMLRPPEVTGLGYGKTDRDETSSPSDLPMLEGDANCAGYTTSLLSIDIPNTRLPGAKEISKRIVTRPCRPTYESAKDSLYGELKNDPIKVKERLQWLEDLCSDAKINARQAIHDRILKRAWDLGLRKDGQILKPGDHYFNVTANRIKNKREYRDAICARNCTELQDLLVLIEYDTFRQEFNWKRKVEAQFMIQSKITRTRKRNRA